MIYWHFNNLITLDYEILWDSFTQDTNWEKQQQNIVSVVCCVFWKLATVLYISASAL